MLNESLIRLEPSALDRVVAAALLEDAPWGDITSQALVPATLQFTADLVAREPGILSGEHVFATAMRLTDPTICVDFLIHDGEPFTAATLIASVSGPAQGVLQAERVALNFIQRMSGIATMTSRYVAATKGTNTRIVDTRKTTPGLRLFERYAVRCGGGHNHRTSLSDAIMAKDNHLAAIGPKDLTTALKAARARVSHTTHIEVEVDRLDQIEAVVTAGIDTIMLDNFSTPDLIAGVKQVAGRCLVEASGGITLQRISEIAATGVDLISVGALTTAARALDLGLDIHLA